MKKPENKLSGDFNFKRILLIMKLTTLLLLINMIHIFAGNAYSQSETLTMNMKDATIKEMFTAIEEKTNYKFLYRDDNLSNIIVNLEAEQMPLEEILYNTLSPAKQTYTILDNNLIVIIPERQGNKITGTVTDASTGEPLIGVNILIEGTNQGAITDVNGRFSLDVPNLNINLVFSYIGYTSQVVALNGRTTFDIELVSDVQTLEEIVVIGYGTQSKRDVSGSVTSVTERSFNKGVTRDAVDLLQGKVAGLVITKGSGDVTNEDQQTIRLRGTSSLTGSSTPFVVIDGVPGLSMSSVAPQDIESISILKDASAGAIYGSRSASGVILITTKKGKAGQATVNYEGYVAIDKVSNKPEMLNASEWRSAVTGMGSDPATWDKGVDTDWFEEIMRTGVSHNHNLSLAGGNESSNYRASFSYLNREGVIMKNEMQRLNGRLTFNQKALKGKLNLTFTGAGTQTDNRPTDTYNFVLAYNMLPVYPVKNDDGTWFDIKEYDQGNPVRNLRYNLRQNKRSLYYTNMKADLEIFDGFIAGLNLFKQREMNDYSEYNNSTTQRGRDDLGYAKRESWTQDKNLLELTLNYTRSIGRSKFGVLGGYSYEDGYYQNMGAQNRHFVTDINEADKLSSGQNLRDADVWSGKNMYKLISFFGRVNYSFNEKYIVTATMRQDGSSKFGKNHKWGTFPSVSAAWRIIGEEFMGSLPAVSDLKLRASWGVTGNQESIDPYKSLALYKASGQYFDNGKWYSAYLYDQNPNPDLKWEQTSMFNIGLDYGFLDNRINGTIDYYNKKTTDLLYTYKVPLNPYLKDVMLANVGAMTNKGIEVLINGEVIQRSDLRWSLSLNFAHNKNEITKLSNEEYTTDAIKVGDAWVRGGSNNTTSIVEEGREVGTFYGWKCLGLDADGKYIMDDMIDGEAGLTDEDRTYIGSAQPKLTYGITSNLTWKNFDFSVFLRGVYGNDVLNFSKMSYATTQWLPGANILKEGLESGLSESPKYCSYYIEKGSFLRLDNASLGYTINVGRSIGIERFRVFVTTQNLFVITNYKGLDPEVSMTSLAPGIEGREYYPKTRTYSLGLSLSF